MNGNRAIVSIAITGMLAALWTALPSPDAADARTESASLSPFGEKSETFEEKWATARIADMAAMQPAPVRVASAEPRPEIRPSEPFRARNDSFREKWMGRIARPPAEDEEASVYWEDTLDARGKRFKPDEVSCAHRTEAFGTIFIVTNLNNGRKIECPVQDRGPYARGRVLDFSRGAARKIGCDGLCRVSIRRAGYE